MALRSKIDFALIKALLAEGRAHPGALSSQIVIIIRYLIATNAIKAGEPLPALREGAKSLGVNMHTLRQAYRQLQDDGYVSVIPSVGVRTADPAKFDQSTSRPISIEEFLDGIERNAMASYGLDSANLAALLHARGEKPDEDRVNFVECSMTQAAMHAQQVEALIGHPCRPVVIDEDAPAPKGVAITTFFHLDDIGRIWPSRRKDCQCVHIKIADEMKQRVRTASLARRKLVICEFNQALGHRIAQDLAAVADLDTDDFEVRTIGHAKDTLQLKLTREAIFVAPRVWGRLPESVTSLQNVSQIIYDIDENDARTLTAKYARRCPPGVSPAAPRDPGGALMS